MINVQLYRSSIGATAFSSSASSANSLAGKKDKLGEHSNWRKFVITSWKRREQLGNVTDMLTICVYDNCGSFQSSIDSCRRYRIKSRPV